MDSLLKYAYPGNVRELENIIHRAVVLSRGELITTGEISGELKTESGEKIEDNSKLDLNEQVESLEKKLVMRALHEAKGNQTQAAKLLGISERNLRYRLNKWGLKN
jgi:two-component system NtrC family response regulator